DGSVAWRNAVAWKLDAASLVGSHIAVVGRTEWRDREKRIIPWMGWISLESGKLVSGAPLTALAAKDPQLGKLLVHPQGVFMSFREEMKDLDMRLHRLEPKSSAISLASYSPLPAAPRLDPIFAAAWAARFPGWSLATIEKSLAASVVEQDEKLELQLQLHPLQETTLIHSGDDGKSLVVRVDRRQVKKEIRIVVRRGNEILLDGAMTDQGNVSQVKLDLPPRRSAGDLVQVALLGEGTIWVRDLTIQ
ncbi:MAG: hypothetical protein ACIALR_04355, partial [Blastopirellula sp. JB062]